jgi:hypothetical protein
MRWVILGFLSFSLMSPMLPVPKYGHKLFTMTHKKTHMLEVYLSMFGIRLDWSFCGRTDSVEQLHLLVCFSCWNVDYVELFVYIQLHFKIFSVSHSFQLNLFQVPRRIIQCHLRYTLLYILI